MKHLCKNCKYCTLILKGYAHRTSYCAKKANAGLTEKVVLCKDFVDKRNKETTTTITITIGDK